MLTIRGFPTHKNFVRQSKKGPACLLYLTRYFFFLPFFSCIVKPKRDYISKRMKKIKEKDHQGGSWRKAWVEKKKK